MEDMLVLKEEEDRRDHGGDLGRVRVAVRWAQEGWGHDCLGVFRGRGNIQ